MNSSNRYSSNPWCLDSHIADSTGSTQQSNPNSVRSNLRQSLQSLGTRLLHWLVNGSDIRVSRSSLPNGEMCWDAYDPEGDRHLKQATEAELRAWIEQRYR